MAARLASGYPAADVGGHIGYRIGLPYQSVGLPFGGVGLPFCCGRDLVQAVAAPYAHLLDDADRGCDLRQRAGLLFRAFSRREGDFDVGIRLAVVRRICFGCGFVAFQCLPQFPRGYGDLVFGFVVFRRPRLLVLCFALLCQ